MERKVYRTASVREYDKIKLKRRLEIAGLVTSAMLMGGLIFSQITIYHDDSTNGSSVTPCSANSSPLRSTTEAVLLDNGSLLAPDGTTFPADTFWVSEGVTWLCPCMMRPCVQKCCPEGEAYSVQSFIDDYGIERNEFICSDHNVSFDLTSKVKQPTAQTNFYVVNGAHICPNRYLLDEIENMNSYLLSDGSLISGQFKVSYDMYCAETIYNVSGVQIDMCFVENTEENKETQFLWIYKVQGAFMLAASVPCLVLTLVSYAVLPPVRNLYGKAFLCHVTCLIVVYSCLGISNIWVNIDPRICKPIGFIIYFAVLGNFFWLNIISFDIWWAFSGLASLRATRKLSQNLKFLLYSFYGWGGPALLLTVALIMEYHPDVPQFFVKPKICLDRCFLSDRESRMLYIYLPIGILMYLNFALFLLTSLRFKSHSNSVKRLERSGSRRHCGVTETCPDVNRYSLYFKLSLVMGVPWLVEVLSFCVRMSYLLHTIDLINALQGVFLLYLFVCNRRTLYLLGHKLCPCLPPFSKQMPTQTSG